MSLKEKLEQLRQQQSEAEEDGRERRRAAEIENQNNRVEEKVLMDKITNFAEEQLKPILEDFNTHWLNGRGVTGSKKDDSLAVVAVEIFWDQKSYSNGTDYYTNFGNGIYIVLGSNFLLGVLGAKFLLPPPIHYDRKEFSLFRPKLLRGPGTGGGRGEGSYQCGGEIPNSRPNINDKDWKERVEKDIVKILERGGEKYIQYECSFVPPDMTRY